ncbi:hypothetical protein [Streptomyces collinus]|uniref:hypothetical protein n=1 Tax=Streptomyces collinus TaxID=42684 RepID=UPI00379E4139
MTRKAREVLSEAIEEYGHDGSILVFHDPEDPLGATGEGADPAPHSGVEEPRSRLREQVAKANARSRGEIL